MKQGKSDIASVSISLKLEMEEMIKIIECYRKKLARLKNVLESVKEDD